MSQTPYPGGPTFTVELGVNSTGVANYAVWDGSTWDATASTWGPDVVWTDITAYVRSGRTQRGRIRDFDHFTAGSMTLELNNYDARFTPANLSGPYVAAGVTQIRPHVPIRVRATFNGITYAVWYGKTVSWQDTYPAQGYNSITTVDCIEQIGDLATFNRSALGSAIGAGETTGARINRILTDARWPLATNIANGQVTVQGTVMSGVAMDELFVTADSEGGALWQDPDGTICFEDQTALLTQTRSNTSQVTFSAAGGAAVPYRDPVPTTDDIGLFNDIQYTRVGGTMQRAADLSSQALYGPTPNVRVRTDLVSQTDAQVSVLAAIELTRSKDAEYRFSKITVIPQKSPSVCWPHVLGRRIRDRAVVTGTIATAGVTISRNVFIDGISHTFDPTNWITDFYFTSATPYDTYSASLWDTGKWDSAIWFF